MASDNSQAGNDAAGGFGRSAPLSQFLNEHGMVVVLLLLCLYYSWATLGRQHPSGDAGAERLARQIARQFPQGSAVLIAARTNEEDVQFADALEAALEAAGMDVVATVRGQPSDARAALDRVAQSGRPLAVIACTRATAQWAVFDGLAANYPNMAATRVMAPSGYLWPTFLMPNNLLNVANQIVVIAIIAIGMTMVIITAGIDLSVGSLLALSAVVAAWLIRGSAHGFDFQPAFKGGWLLTAIVASLAGAALVAAGRAARIIGLQTLGWGALAFAAVGLANVVVPHLFARFLPALEWLGPTPLGMTVCCLLAIGLTALIGSFSGVMVTVFRMPPFINTLGMMLVASGLAYIVPAGQSISEVPDSFVWLGRGAITDPWLAASLTAIGKLLIAYAAASLLVAVATLLVPGITAYRRRAVCGLALAGGAAWSLLGPAWAVPVAILLMGVLYVMAHVVMTRTTFGRYVYAVGGNPEAARLSGVPVRRVLLAVYIICGALAGLGGVVLASQLKAGSPTYGLMYELYVIAAVVVGGTSLAGGQGKIVGTLIGAFIIAVIQNGMNLTGVESYTQKVVLGAVVLGAVLLDNIKKRGWLSFARHPRRQVG